MVAINKQCFFCLWTHISVTPGRVLILLHVMCSVDFDRLKIVKGYPDPSLTSRMGDPNGVLCKPKKDFLMFIAIIKHLQCPKSNIKIKIVN